MSEDYDILSAATKEDLREVAASLGFNIEPKYEADYLWLLQHTIGEIRTVTTLPEYIHPLLKKENKAEARTYTEAKGSENPLNAWRYRTIIKPTGSGLLSGKTIAIKDNISIAGLPLTGGTEPFYLSRETPYPISDFDAPVISRVLEAGATIIGTSTCENYCMSGSSFTSATGPVDNPWLKGRSSGGSSSGSAALTAITSIRQWNERHDGADSTDDGLGEGVDFAIGTDQGGSIRLPASYCGIYGLKPTHGLVPYTGLTSLHPMIDHCGPIAGSIRDTALLLTVLAGYDGLDPRMTPETPLRQNVPQYHELLDKEIETRRAAGTWTPTSSARGLRVGFIGEAWWDPELTGQVSIAVKKAVERFALHGAVVEKVSLFLHTFGAPLFTGMTSADMADVFVSNRPPDLLSWPLTTVDPPAAPDAKWYDTMNRTAPAAVNRVLSARYFQQHRDEFPLTGRGRAMRYVHKLRAAYDAELDKYDVLITPAAPSVGLQHPDMDATGVLKKKVLALGNTWNTCPFNLTGHPGLVIPVGWGKTEDGHGRLPIGMQLIGKRWGEDKLFLAAAAWEVGGLGIDQ